MMRRLGVRLGFAVVFLAAAACGESVPESPATTTASPSPTAPSPTPCATVVSGPGQVELCGVVNDAGRADVTDQGSSVALTIETPPPGLVFDPTFIKAEAGGDVTVTVNNTWTGSGPQTIHSFSIDALDISEVVRAGETTEVAFTLPEDEPYLAFYCAVASGAHLRSGMQGAFHFE